jgi:hypothetical protein
MPEAPAGITHIPDLQTPLAQSGPVAQVVFGSITVGMQYPPVHLPLWQSLAWVQCEPAGEPELALPSEPMIDPSTFELEPPVLFNPPKPNPPRPPPSFVPPPVFPPTPLVSIFAEPLPPQATEPPNTKRPATASTKTEPMFLCMPNLHNLLVPPTTDVDTKL